MPADRRLNFLEKELPPVLLIKHVAAALNTSEKHVYDLIDDGSLKAIDVAGRSNSGRRRLRIPRTWLAEYIQQKTTV